MFKADLGNSQSYYQCESDDDANSEDMGIYEDVIKFSKYLRKLDKELFYLFDILFKTEYYRDLNGFGVLFKDYIFRFHIYCAKRPNTSISLTLYRFSCIQPLMNKIISMGEITEEMLKSYICSFIDHHYSIIYELLFEKEYSGQFLSNNIIDLMFKYIYKSH